MQGHSTRWQPSPAGVHTVRRQARGYGLGTARTVLEEQRHTLRMIKVASHVACGVEVMKDR